jgi:hypothetical protein
MTLELQIAIDCHDPHLLNRFWASVMGYEVESHDAQIRQLLDAGIASAADTMEVDGQLWWKEAAACHGSSGARLLFQQVPEPKVCKNRVHLDLHFGDDEQQRSTAIDRAIAAGATKLWDGQLGPHTWVTLADPEGNEFCIG